MEIALQNIRLLDQIDSLLNLLDQNVFTKKHAFINHSTVGQHTRHILEFYHCILQHFPSQRVCYDDRKRSLDLEQSIILTKEAICHIKNGLSSLADDVSITFVASYSETHDNKESIPSSLKRELAYAMDHTVHHLAIIKIILNLEGLKMEEFLGVAPSTIRFNKQNTVVA